MSPFSLLHTQLSKGGQTPEGVCLSRGSRLSVHQHRPAYKPPSLLLFPPPPPPARSDNILALELDLPERVTFDMLPDGQGPDPRVQAAIDSAFWEDGHILLMGRPGSPQQQLHLLGQDMGGYAVPSPKQQLRPGSAGQRRTAGQASVVP